MTKLVYQVGDYRIDELKREIRLNGQLQELEALAFDVLTLLIRERGRVVSKDELLAEVWPGRVVTEAALYRTISLARDALDGLPQKSIKTVHGRGYRFVGPVEPVSHSQPTTAAGTGPWLKCLPALLLVIAAAAWFNSRTTQQQERSDGRAPVREPNSIAVLPLSNPAAPVDNRYFGYAVAEEILAQLTRFPGLHVAAPHSSFKFADELDLIKVGDQLGVEQVLVGSWRYEADQYTVTAQLIDTTNGDLVWTQRFQRPVGSVAEIQEQLSEAIAVQLQLELRNEVGESLPLRALVPGTAYERYLQARQLWRDRDPGKLAEAVELLEQVVFDAPNFARAHEALASIYRVLPEWQTVDRTKSQDLAFAAAREALRLEPRLGEARAILASEAQEGADWATAELLYEEALAREPGNATIIHWYAQFLMQTGRLDQALVFAERGVQLDTLSPMTHTVNAWAALLLNLNDQAIEHGQEAVRLGLPTSNIILAMAFSRNEESSLAAAALEGLPSPTPSTQACREAVVGSTDAQKAVATIEAEPYSGELAAIYRLACLGLLGEVDQIMPRLASRGATNTAALLWAPEFAQLRSEPAFMDWVGAVGLIEYWERGRYPNHCRVVSDGVDCF